MTAPRAIILTCDPTCIPRVNHAMVNSFYQIGDIIDDFFRTIVGDDYYDTLDNLADYIYGDLSQDLHQCAVDDTILDHGTLVENILQHLYTFLHEIADQVYRTVPRYFHAEIRQYQFTRMMGADAFLIEQEVPARHPLIFGSMDWKPELVPVLPVSRRSAQDRPLTLQPSFTSPSRFPDYMEVLDLTIDKESYPRRHFKIRTGG